MKTNLIILLTILLFNQTCCKNKDDCHKSITFVNTTSQALYVIASSLYPDTLTFSGIPNPLLDPNFTKVLPNETNTQVLSRRDCIELTFKNLIPPDILMVYVFDAMVIESTPWETVKSNYLVVKRYDLSLQDLQNNNWKIIYP